MSLATDLRDVLDAYTSVLADQAVWNRGVPEALAHEARMATLRNLRIEDTESADGLRIRAQAYFNETVRRMSARSSAPEVARYRRRVIARLIAEDLRRCGVSEDRIEREVDEWAVCSA